jgi:hypothetical protein
MAQVRENDYPRWASDGGADVVEPNEGRKDTGFVDDDEADAAEFNWLHRTQYRWARWLDEDHAGREIRGTTSWMQAGFGFAVAGGPASLTGACGPGVISRAGARLELDADFLTATGQDAHTFTASRDTYVFIDDERVFTFSAVANGAGAPATPPGTTLFQVVVTDGTDITGVTDSVLRGPICAPAEGMRFSPHITIGLNGGVPAEYFDVGTGGAGAVLETIGESAPSPTTVHYSRIWSRSSARINEVLAGAASIYAVGNNDTNTTAKQYSWAALHYTSAEEPVGLVRAAIDNVDNTVQIGGGASHLNAATRVQLYAAATRTTTTGTMLLELQGSGGLVYMPGGLAQLGNGSSSTPVFTINRVNGSEGGVEHSEASSRRWLGPYTAAGADDLVFWRFSGGSDQGVSLRFQSSDGLVQVETVAGLRVRNTGSLTVRGLRLNTHVGQESGLFDADEFEEKTKVVQTNTNGNEDIAIVGSSDLPQDGAYWIEVRILGVQDTQVLNTYGRRMAAIYVRDGASSVSFQNTIEDTTAGAAVGGGWTNANAALSISGSDLIVRVTATDTVVRNWIIKVTYGLVRALNS